MRERFRSVQRGCFISMPGLVTGGFLEQLANAGQQLPERPYDLPTKTVQANGTELNYFEFGEGDLVVLVHGSVSDYRTWGNQFEPLSVRYRVIAYSRRYHYPNAWSGDGSDYCTALHAQDLASFIQVLDLGPAHLVGQSSGATIAALCASRHPELTRTLIVNEPDHAPWLMESVDGQAVLQHYLERIDQPAAKLLATGDAEGALRIYVDGVQYDGAYDALTPEMRAVMLDNVPELKAELRCADIFYSAFTFDDTRRIRAPTLLLQGGASLPLFRLIADRFAEHVPQIERVIVPGAPHAIHVVAPEEFSGAVLAFLDRNGP